MHTLGLIHFGQVSDHLHTACICQDVASSELKRAQKHLRFWIVWLRRGKAKLEVAGHFPAHLLTEAPLALPPCYCSHSRAGICIISPHPHLGVKCVYIKSAEKNEEGYRGSGGNGDSGLLETAPLSDVCKIPYSSG